MVEKERKIRKDTDWLGLVSFGFFVILLGIVWITTANIWEKTGDFFRSFQLVNVTSSIALPAPTGSHPVVYTAAMQFCLVFGAFQIFILAFKFVIHEPLNKIGDTVSGIVFWFGASYLFSLLASDSIRWFSFVAGILMLIGIMIIIGSMFKFFKKG